MKMINLNKEVSYLPTQKIIAFDKKLFSYLKKKVDKTKSKKFRICLHKNENSKLHEMIIIHKNKTYVRPHKHINKSESMEVLKGSATLIFFNQYGKITKTLKLGAANSGKTFFYKIKKNIMHTFLFHSKYFIFKETTSGPFVRSNTVFPDWSPENKNIIEAKKFMSNLKYLIKKRK